MTKNDPKLRKPGLIHKKKHCIILEFNFYLEKDYIKM